MEHLSEGTIEESKERERQSVTRRFKSAKRSGATNDSSMSNWKNPWLNVCLKGTGKQRDNETQRR